MSDPKRQLHLSRLRDALEMVSEFRVGHTAREAAFTTWKQRTQQALVTLFGDDHAYSKRFRSLHFCEPRASFADRPNPWLDMDQRRYDADLAQAKSILEDALEELDRSDTDAGSGKADAEQASIPDLETIFSLLHPTVQVFSRERFANGHYADAVEAVMKALNIEVRRIAKERGAPEMDGAQLMHSAFSPGRPVIALGDLSTQSGRDTQQGFMEMFAGAMSAIRNPKAHDNVVISPERAIHLLFVASTLWFTLDARL